MDASRWYQPYEILRVSRANLRAMGVSMATIASLTDAQMHELALALQSRYVQYGGGFDRVVLRFVSELFLPREEESHP